MNNPVSHIFNIRLSCSFWETLARIYLERYKEKQLEFASVLFLVPNRRACQALTSAFLQQQGLSPTILPQIIPIAEIDNDELFFSQFGFGGNVKTTTSVISKEERLFLFSRLI